MFIQVKMELKCMNGDHLSDNRQSNFSERAFSFFASLGNDSVPSIVHFLYEQCK